MRQKEPLPEVSFDENKYSIPGFELVKTDNLPNNIIGELDHNPYKPHRLNFYTVLIINSGMVIQSIDIKEYKLVKGDCLFISKGQIRAFDPNANFMS